MAMSETRSSTALWLPDLVAGLSVAGLLVPEAVAYSGIAGLPPQYGIIALLAGLTCYGLLGRSRFAIVSATFGQICDAEGVYEDVGVKLEAVGLDIPRNL